MCPTLPGYLGPTAQYSAYGRHSAKKCALDSATVLSRIPSKPYDPHICSHESLCRCLESPMSCLECFVRSTADTQVIPLGEQDDLADIRKEIGFLAACDHPNIVRYLVCPCLLPPSTPDL